MTTINPRKRLRELSSATPGSGRGENNKNMVGPDVFDSWDDSSQPVRGPGKQMQRDCERGNQISGGNHVDTDEELSDSEIGSSD